MYLRWSGNQFSVTAGFYTSWGQGLVLNLKKVDELGVDTTLVVGIRVGAIRRFKRDSAGQTNAESRIL